MLLTFCVLSLSAQSISLTVGGDTTSQIGSNGKQAEWFEDFDTECKNMNIVKEEDGFYYYSYDWCCEKVDLFDDRYWVKLFVGKTYEEVLTSFNTIIEWYKNAKEGEYVTIENPDGQRILIYKIWLGGGYISYGTLDDIQWNKMQSKMPTTGFGLYSDTSEGIVYNNIQTRVAEGKFHPTGYLGSKMTFRATIKTFKKKYKKQYGNKK